MYEFFCMTRVASLVILLFFCLFTSSVAGCEEGKITHRVASGVEISD